MIALYGGLLTMGIYFTGASFLPGDDFSPRSRRLMLAIGAIVLTAGIMGTLREVFHG